MKAIFIALLILSLSLCILAKPEAKNSEKKTDNRANALHKFCQARAAKECPEDYNKEECLATHLKTCETYELKWRAQKLAECDCKSLECEASDRKCARKLEKCERKCLNKACKARATEECKPAPGSNAQEAETKPKKCIKKAKKACRTAHVAKRHQKHEAAASSQDAVVVGGTLVKPKDGNKPADSLEKLIQRGCKKRARKSCKHDDDKKGCVATFVAKCQEEEVVWRGEVLDHCLCAENCGDERSCEKKAAKCQKRCLKKACSQRAKKECKPEAAEDKKRSRAGRKQKKCVKRAARACRRTHIKSVTHRFGRQVGRKQMMKQMQREREMRTIERQCRMESTRKCAMEEAAAAKKGGKQVMGREQCVTGLIDACKEAAAKMREQILQTCKCDEVDRRCLRECQRDACRQKAVEECKDTENNAATAKNPAGHPLPPPPPPALPMRHPAGAMAGKHMGRFRPLPHASPCVRRSEMSCRRMFHF